MCGIAGYFGPSVIPEARIRQCLHLMRRRGPDAADYRQFARHGGGSALLLHTRLAIIDLDERSNQPFGRGGKWLAFNGEIYNYLEMRKELEAAGAQFRTSSDTEVLLAAIECEGGDAFRSAEGMWALACYDEASGHLLLSRDRFGEKPLYLYRDGGGIYFGSEPKFIMALLGRRLPVNQTQLRRYLVNGYKSLYKVPATFFEGLEELPPATTMRIDGDGSEKREAYWRPVFAPDESMSQAEAVAGMRERLIESVRLRLRSDVPLAFLMSGGVDSNVLIGIAKRVFNYDVHGFTIINDDERYDERAIVNAAVQELGIRHTSVPITPADFLPRLRELVRYHDAPVFTITYYVQWLLMQQVHAHGYKITFSGTGADELVTGYYDHYLMHLAEINGTPLHAPALKAWEEHIKPVVRNPYLGNPSLFIDNPGERNHIYLGADGFAEYLVRPFAEGFAEEAYCGSLLRNRMMNEMFHEAVPVILHEDDLNAMYYSIENRSPYLDRGLFEFCYTIPTRHLIRDGFNKVILRDAARGIAPDVALDRRIKVGFNAPVLSFLDPSDPAVRDELLADGPLFDLLRRDKVEALLDKRALPNSQSKFLFNLVNAKVFLEEFTA
ncbi:MAG: asparagine synthase (glutamine-hydrolyzing) [Ferrovibrio sp.]|uniref:asparagine synthase (glutamine-hydrolyzing) n=1 Tax=Ferrovibrio sp. TaxID=1917215 RepID=UPI003919637E